MSFLSVVERRAWTVVDHVAWASDPLDVFRGAASAYRKSQKRYDESGAAATDGHLDGLHAARFLDEVAAKFYVGQTEQRAARTGACEASPAEALPCDTMNEIYCTEAWRLAETSATAAALGRAAVLLLAKMTEDDPDELRPNCLHVETAAREAEATAATIYLEAVLYHEQLIEQRPALRPEVQKMAPTVQTLLTLISNPDRRSNFEQCYVRLQALAEDVDRSVSHLLTCLEMLANGEDFTEPP